MLPNFLILGSMKSGTTSLWRYLRAHPQIYLPETKELDFFLEEGNWSLGWKWYESQFQTDRSGVVCFGEASTNYSKFPAFSGVAEKIAAGLPGIKLLYLVRDPIERIRSMYVHKIFKKEETRSFQEVMQNLENNHYVQVSLYHFQLAQYLEFFQRNQILVISSEDLAKHRMEVLQQIFAFLDVDTSFECDEFHSNFFVSSRLSRPRTLGILFDKLRLQATLAESLSGRARRWFQKATESRISKPRVSKSLRRQLCSIFEPDVKRLRDFTGQNFPYWSL